MDHLLSSVLFFVLSLGHEVTFSIETEVNMPVDRHPSSSVRPSGLEVE